MGSQAPVVTSRPDLMLVRAADQLPITDRVQNGAMTSVTHKAKTQGSVEARAEKQHWSRFGFLK